MKNPATLKFQSISWPMAVMEIRPDRVEDPDGFFERHSREMSALRQMKGRAFERTIFEAANGHKMNRYFSMPDSWQADDYAWRGYVQSRIGRKVEEGEDVDGLLLDYMIKHKQNFAGIQSNVLKLFGERMLVHHTAKVLGLTLVGLRELGCKDTRLTEAGRFYIDSKNWKPEKKLPYQMMPGISLETTSKIRHNEQIAHHCKLLFKHYPLDAFVEAIQTLDDWKHFVAVYGDDEVMKHQAGRRYVLSRDLGL